MAYHIIGTKSLIFCANPRTGSTAVAKALRDMGATIIDGHHRPPRYIPSGAIVCQTVRSHWDVLNSLWFRGRPTGKFEHFIEAVCAGRYELATVPMYQFKGITFNMRYETLQADFTQVCVSAGLNPPQLPVTPTRTSQPASETFKDSGLIRLVQKTYDNEMYKFGLRREP